MKGVWQAVERIEFISCAESDTERLGRVLARTLVDGATIALCGTLGAGKTRLVQAIAVAMGVDRQRVVSPTFTLCHEYHGERRIEHLDLYRLRDEDELRELGFDEYVTSPALTFIEWADRFPDSLPEEHVMVEITVEGESKRRFVITASGPEAAEFRVRLRDELAAESTL